MLLLTKFETGARQEMAEQLDLRLAQMQDFSQNTAESLELVKREDLSGAMKSFIDFR